MQTSKSQLTKSNLQSKLRLKRNNSDSSQSPLCSHNKSPKSKIDNRENESNSDKESHEDRIPTSPKPEDSLADFKSPKEEKTIRPLISKFRIEVDKKKKIMKSKSKSSSRTRRSISDQPSIESSFFKPLASNQNAKESFLCPLCLKPFKDDEIRSNHMKGCAARNKVSTKQLLDAKDLLERQAEERKAMGLLAAPVLPERKKGFRSKNYSTGDDLQLQLAMAISESLVEARQMEELEEAAILSGFPSECIKEMNYEERKSTLQSFGFTTNKPVIETATIRTKKKKLAGPTILQSRSKEDKDRVLTERIACILTGSDALTQIQEKTKICIERTTRAILKSGLLKKFEQTNKKLWDKSKLTTKRNDFYVKGLQPHTLLSEDQPLEIDSDDTDDDSIVYNPEKIEIIDNPTQEENKSMLTNMRESENPKNETDFMKNSIANWRDILNDSSASDLVIIVKDSKHIFAHKLVFHVQCSNILLHVEPNYTEIQSQVKEKISWPGRNQSSALAFLEFIYCGTIEKYVSIFENEILLLEVEQLARLYRIEALFSYLKYRQRQCASEKLQTSTGACVDLSKDCSMDINDINGSNLCSNSNNKTSSVEKLFEKNNDPDQLNNSEKQSNKSLENDSISNETFKKNLYDRQFTASPDLFESEDEDSLHTALTQKDTTVRRTSNDEKTENPDDESDKYQQLCSQQTIVNLSRPSSPESEKSFREDIQEAITPIYLRSPARRSSAESEKDNNDDVAAALTPKSRSPNRLNVKQEIEMNEAVSPESNARSNDGGEAARSDDESIYTAVTPPKSGKAQFVLEGENLKKVRTDLSLFIDKVQRQNAKDAFDTDSEAETPNPKIKPRHPFLKKLQDESYEYLKKDGNKVETRKRVLSLLEKDIMEEKKKSSALEEGSSQKHDNITEITCSQKVDVQQSEALNEIHNELSNNSVLDDDIEDLTLNETDISMYSRYKKTNTKENSIAIYREKLLHSNENSSPELRNNDVQNDTTKISSKKIFQTIAAANPKDPIGDITLVSDSDEETDGLKSSLMQTSQGNSSTSITEFSNIENDRQARKIVNSAATPAKFESSISTSREKLNSSVRARQERNDKTKSCSNKIFHTTETAKPKAPIDDVTLVSDSDEEDDSKKCTLKQKIEKNSITESYRKDDEKELTSTACISNIENDTTFPLELVTGQSSKIVNSTALPGKPGSKVIDISLDSEEEIHNDSTFPYNLVVESDISLAKRKETTTEQKEYLDFSEKKNDDIDIEIRKILQSSNDSINKEKNLSHELENVDHSKDNEQNDDNHQHKVINLSPISICSSPEVCNTKKDNTPNQDDTPQNNRQLMNIDNDFFDDNDDIWNRKTPPKETVMKSNIHSSPTIDRTSSKSSASQNAKLSSKSQDKSPSNEEVRKLKHKSASTSSWSQETNKPKEHKLQRSSSFTTSTASSIEYVRCVTPPVDYNKLSSPELQKHCKKYGLKPNLGRVKTVKLLNHLYDSLHPVIPVVRKRASTNSSSDEEGPPLKKKPAKRTSRASYVAEEMEYNEPEVGNHPKNPIITKDAFNKIIKSDMDMYTKVLIYEPLPLEPLHSLLKEKGLKCKINDLMDFLDEQCITFQVQTGKGSRTKKKK